MLLLVNGTLSTMRALKMLPGQPRYIENPVWLEKIVDIISDGPGIWYPLVKPGTYVQEGMKLGYVTDYFGRVILEPRAPAVVLHVNAVPSLKKGDNIAKSWHRGIEGAAMTKLARSRGGPDYLDGPKL